VVNKPDFMSNFELSEQEYAQLAQEFNTKNQKLDLIYKNPANKNIEFYLKNGGSLIKPEPNIGLRRQENMK
jgi:hypothetical protein